VHVSLARTRLWHSRSFSQASVGPKIVRRYKAPESSQHGDKSRLRAANGDSPPANPHLPESRRLTPGVRDLIAGALVTFGCASQQLVQLSLDADHLGDQMIHQGVQLRRRQAEFATGEMPRDVLARRGQFVRSHLCCRQAQLVGFELDADSRASRTMLLKQSEDRIQRFREKSKNFEEHAIGARGVELADDR
jgi:hypothetical protein